MATMPYHEETATQQHAFDTKTLAKWATQYYGNLFENRREDDTNISALISRRA